MRLEDALLFGGGEAGVERDDLDLPQLLGEVFLCFADLPLARQKAEDVARRLPEQGAGRPFDSLRNIEDWRVRIVGVAERLIPDLDGVRAARHLDDGCGPPGGVGEVSGELLGVDRGRGDDHVKVVAPFDESAQVAEQEVDVERPLVGFVDDDRVVPTEIRVALEFGEEDAFAAVEARAIRERALTALERVEKAESANVRHKEAVAKLTADNMVFLMRLKESETELRNAAREALRTRLRRRRALAAVTKLRRLHRRRRL